MKKWSPPVYPVPGSKSRVKVGRDGVFRFTVPMRVNDVVLVTLSPDKTR